MAGPEIISHCTISGTLKRFCTLLRVFLTLLSHCIRVYNRPTIIYIASLSMKCVSPLAWLLSDISISYKLVGLGVGTSTHSRPFAFDHLTISLSSPELTNINYAVQQPRGKWQQFDSDFAPDYFKQSLVPCVQNWVSYIDEAPSATVLHP